MEKELLDYKKLGEIGIKISGVFIFASFFFGYVSLIIASILWIISLIFLWKSQNNKFVRGIFLVMILTIVIILIGGIKFICDNPVN